MKRKYEYNGEQYTLHELSDKTGIPYSTLYNRLTSKKLSVEDAIMTQSSGRPQSEVIYKGKKTTYTALARKAGIPRASLYARVTRLGMTIEEALKKPYRPKKGDVKGDAPKCCAPDCDNCPFADCVI